MTDNYTIQQALDALYSSDLEERHSAIKTLGEARHRPAVPYLTEVLRTEDDPTLHFTIVMALGKIGDAAPLPEVLVALRGNDMWVRVAATDALIKIGLASVPGLIEAASDDNKAVRRAAIKALGKIGDSAATPVLYRALSDSDSAVRRFAAEALDRINPV